MRCYPIQFNIDSKDLENFIAASALFSHLSLNANTEWHHVWKVENILIAEIKASFFILNIFIIMLGANCNELSRLLPNHVSANLYFGGGYVVFSFFPLV